LSQRPQRELRSTAPREPPFTANSRLSRPAAARFLPDAVNLGPDSRSLLHNPHAGPWVSFGFAPKIQPRPLLFSSPMNPHETKMLQTPDWYYCILAFSSFEAGKSLAHGTFPSFSVTHDAPGIFCSLHIFNAHNAQFHVWDILLPVVLVAFFPLIRV